MVESVDSAVEIGRCGSEQEKASSKQPRQSLIARAIKQISSLFELLWKLGYDDHRRAIHALKVGLALSLVCLLMILEPAYNEIGKNTVWAVMTVIVIFEFTAGATLCKGLNRGFGTFVAALLALGISHLSAYAGDQAEAVIVGFSVFIIGAGSTFVRFLPKIKARFDYGVVIFLLTFSMIVVLGYQDIDSVRTSLDRLFTICIGCGISLIISVLVCPIWAGEDLQLLIVSNLRKLSLSLKECVAKYVSDDPPIEHRLSKVLMGETDDDPIYNQYRGALLSSATEESLANFASWEPPHGRFRLRHPWKKYLKVGVAMRHCAYGIVALHSCLHSDAQAPFLLRQVFREELLQVATEAASVLQDLSETIKTMETRSNTRDTLDSASKAARNLHKLISGKTRLFFSSDTWSLQQTAPPKEGPAPVADALISQSAADDGNVRMQLSTEAAAVTKDGLCKSRILMHRLFSSPLPSSNSSTLQAELSASLLSLATFASLLVEVVARLGLVVDAVDDLAKAAHYKGQEKCGKMEGDQFEATTSGRELSSQNQSVE
ncbi:hypothetical protein O6H91_10G080100 [Diphasiastrum complanatum]|uniref:Uncharacterized protein n=1 Tax=Diphasiastrum complanatum TaxID=34168 RepID=A0ACC2CIK4_DIPCM|nr:hypothetical protein O6H91_10G080100 [Diphasiastrum complanatum]